MNFTYAELARLYKMIGIAFVSGKIETDEISEAIHRKISAELSNRNVEEKEVV